MTASWDTPLVCPVLIGRDGALASLRSLLATVCEGSGRIALVTGEAGIGKSRLVAELKATVRADGANPAPTIAQGNCFEPDRSLPYAPLLDLLDGLVAGRSPTEIRAHFGDTTPDLAKLVPAIARAIPDAVPTPESDPEQEKRRLFQAIAQTLVRIATPAPLLLVIEDIHWCDDTSLEFFLYLARRIAAERFLLVFTYRSDELHPALAHFLAMLDRERIATEYALARLTAPQVETMLRAIFGPAARLRREMTEAIFTLTEGNPFFIEEIAKSVGTDEDTATPLTELVQVPRSVQDAVRRRSAQLDTAARDLLRVAAVAGRRFDFALLHAVTGQDEAALLRAIKQLIAAQFVTEESADQFAFRHALTQQAIYGELLARERRALHRTLAETIARLAETPDEHLASLAYHAYEAGMWEQALDYSRRVGARALALYAPRAAVEHFTRALGAAWQLTQAPPAALYRSRGLAYGTLGEFERARADHETALQAAHAAGDRHGEWQSLLDLGALWSEQDYERAGEFFRRATDLAEQLGDASIHARSLNRLANWLVNTGHATKALPVHREALAIFTRASDARGMAETLDLLGMASGFSGSVVAAVHHYERAIALFRASDERQLLSHCLSTKAVLASPSMNDTTWSPRDTPERGAAEMDEALRLARQAGWRAGEAYVHWQASALHASYGALSAALMHGEAALRVASEIEHRQWIAASRWTLGQTYVYLLMPEAAIAQLEIGLPLARELGSAWWVAHHAATLAQAYLLRGDAARASLGLETSLPRDGLPRIAPERRVAWMWGEVALARRDAVRALQVADALIASAPGPRSGPAIPWLARLRGEAYAMQGANEEAERALVAACIAATEQHALPLLWQVHRARGHLYRRQRRDERAEQAFTEARTVSATLAESIADDVLRARFQRAALATMPKKRAPTARQIATERYGGLTTREREVAAEIAHGKSNRAIAETLFLSERTVATHITNILGKLDLSSRAQIATWAVARGLDERAG